MAKPKKISVDFTGVEGGGRPVPDGEYLLRMSSVEETTSLNDNPMLKCKWMVAEGELEGAGPIYDNVSLTPQALWRFKGLLECIGIQANGKTEIDVSELKGCLVVCEVENETYQGKERPKIINFLRGVEEKKAAPTPTPAQTPTPAAGGTTRRVAKPAGRKVGDVVQFASEGEDFEGTISSITGTTVLVKVPNGNQLEEWEIDLSELK